MHEVHEPPHRRTATAAAGAPVMGAAAAARGGGRAATEAGMNLDDRLSLEGGNNGRDHRSRATPVQDQLARSSPGTPTERTQAGGAVPVSRQEGDPTRDATAGEQQARADEQRRNAERELARALRLPADTRLDILVDPDKDEVRFQIRDRASGRLLREVPPDENKPLLEKLKEFAGAFVDRSF